MGLRYNQDPAITNIFFSIGAFRYGGVPLYIHLPPKTKELLCPVVEKGRWIAEHSLKTLSQAAKQRKSKMKIKTQGQATVLAFLSFFLDR